MKWKNPADRNTLEASISSESEARIFRLVNDFSEWWEPGKTLDDYEPKEVLSPDALAHALVLLVEAFEEGEQLFAEVGPFGKLLLSARVSFLLSVQAQEAGTGVD